MTQKRDKKDNILLSEVNQKINLKKNIFTSEEVNFIINKLRKAAKIGLVTVRKENNPYLLASFKGADEKKITPKWNVKIYNYNNEKKGHSLVCVDLEVLERLLKEDYESFTPPELITLQIDDAGWGFPLGGVMVGISDGKEIRTAVVPVEYFRKNGKNNFATKRYLKEYAKLAIDLLEQFKATPKTHRIEICTGYVNQYLKEKLRNMGYNVRVVEIKGKLQEELEKIYKSYIIEEVGKDIYYDPKLINKSEISQRYKEAISYAKEHFPHKIKNGWKALNYL